MKGSYESPTVFVVINKEEQDIERVDINTLSSATCDPPCQ